MNNEPAITPVPPDVAPLFAGLEPQIASLHTLSLPHRLFELTFFPIVWLTGGLLALQGYNTSSGPAAYTLIALGTLACAAALNAFVLLLHEGMHFTLFRNRFLNRCLSVALGGCALISFTAYQVLHLRHHRHLGDDRDPDDYHNYTGSPVKVWILHYVRLVCGSLLYLFLIPILAIRHGHARDRRRILQEYAVLALAYTAIFALLPIAPVARVWLLPLLIVGWMVSIRGFTQHGITDAHDPLLASRTVHPNRLISFFLLNENLHLEHHLFPRVPSHNLPKLARLIDPRLPRKVTGRSYLGFIARFLWRTPRMDESPIGLTESKSPTPELS